MNELRSVADTTAVLVRYQIDETAAEKVVQLMEQLEGLSDDEAEQIATSDVALG